MEKHPKLRALQLLLIGLLLAPVAYAQSEPIPTLPIDTDHEWFGPVPEHDCDDCWIPLEPYFSARDLEPDTRLTPLVKEADVPGFYFGESSEGKHAYGIQLMDDNTYRIQKGESATRKDKWGHWFLKGDTVLLFEEQVDRNNLAKSVRTQCLIDQSQFVVEVVDRNGQPVANVSADFVFPSCELGMPINVDEHGYLGVDFAVGKSIYRLPLDMDDPSVNYFFVTLAYSLEELEANMGAGVEPTWYFKVRDFLFPAETIERYRKGFCVRSLMERYRRSPELVMAD